jgi:hypothetical protein
MPFRKKIGRFGMPPDIVQRPHEGSSLENMTIELESDVRLKRTMESVRTRDLCLSISPSRYQNLASGRASNLASKLLLINERMDVIVLDTIAPALLV